MLPESLAAGAIIFPLIASSDLPTSIWSALEHPFPHPAPAFHPDSPYAETWHILVSLCAAGLMSATVLQRTHPGAPPSHSLYVRVFIPHISLGRRPAMVETFQRLVRTRPAPLLDAHGKRKREPKMAVETAMRTILSWVRRDVAAWECADEGPMPEGSMFYDQLSDNRTLSDIFNSLPRPSAPHPPPPLPPSERGPSNHPDRPLPLSSVASLLPAQPVGLRTTLYSYQLETVRYMLGKELSPGTAPDPRYVPVRSVVTPTSSSSEDEEVDEEEWMWDPESCILRHASDIQYESVSGGVLCEAMGSGKTCISIALIVSTLGRLARPPRSGGAQNPALTKGAIEGFPWQTYAEHKPPWMPDHALEPKEMKMQIQEHENARPPYPTLRELAFQRAFDAPLGPSLSATLLQPRFLAAATRLRGFATHRLPDLAKEIFPGGKARGFYYEPKVGAWALGFGGRETRGAIKAEQEAEWELNGGRREGVIWLAERPKVWLSALSLVVVPDHLKGQWQSEFMKHCDDDAVRVCTIGDKIPSVEELVENYDVILMTQHRFAKEGAPSVTRSPLRQIRFLRLIIDEGTVVASEHSNQVKALAQKLSVDARWVVTGTPTRHFKASQLGSSKEEQAAEAAPRQPGEAGWALKKTKEDLAALGHFVEFLCVPPFACPPLSSDGSPLSSALPGDADWSSAIVRPLTHSDAGPDFGAVYRLQTCLARVLVRHPAREIDQDVSLPKMTHEVIKLDIGKASARMYNSLLAQFSINAVDSQRTDKDYLFHPGNRGHLAVSMANLSQSLFWSTDDKTVWEERVDTAQKALGKTQTRDTSAADVKLIENSIQHLKSAMYDAEWRAIQQREALPFVTSGLPDALQAAWIRTEALGRPDDTCLFEHDRLEQLRKVACFRLRDVGKNSLEELVDLGKKFHAYEKSIDVHVQSLEEAKKGGKKNSKAKADPASAGQPSEPENQVYGVQAQQPHVPHSLSKRAISKSAINTEEWKQKYDIILRSASAGVLNTVFPPDSLLARTQIGQSLSVKVNYIVSEILEHQANEKTVIFSSSPLSLAYLCEAFHLYNIKYLEFQGGVSGKSGRDSTLKTFETSDHYRVLLMELKHGARGLNIVSASRIIFCEPVWKADEQSQAIKRCHRIGQIKDVTVKTVVIAGTHEAEAELVRKTLRQDDDEDQAAYDVSIKDFMSNPRFLEGREVEWPRLRLPLLRTSNTDPAVAGDMEAQSEDSKERSEKRKREDEGGNDAEEPASPTVERPQPKKKARVQMADMAPALANPDVNSRATVVESSAASGSSSRPKRSREDSEEAVESMLDDRPKKKLRFAPEPGDSSTVQVVHLTGASALVDATSPMTVLTASSNGQDNTEVVHTGTSDVAGPFVTPPPTPPLSRPGSRSSQEVSPPPVTPTVVRATELPNGMLVDDPVEASPSVQASLRWGKRPVERATELPVGMLVGDSVASLSLQASARLRQRPVERATELPLGMLVDDPVQASPSVQASRRSRKRPVERATELPIGMLVDDPAVSPSTQRSVHLGKRPLGEMIGEESSMWDGSDVPRKIRKLKAVRFQ